MECLTKSDSAVSGECIYSTLDLSQRAEKRWMYMFNSQLATQNISVTPNFKNGGEGKDLEVDSHIYFP